LEETVLANKGSAFEREISKFLSKWLTGSEKPYQYWRMPGSGCLCTISEENADLSGDIRSLTTEAKFLTDLFSIELKTGYPQTSFWQHFAKIKGFKLKEFWQQATRDASKSEKRPMLIYRKKGKKVLIGIDYETYDIICYHINDLTLINNIRMYFSEEKEDLLPLVLMDFYDFFETMKPENIKNIWHK
jgi:hypothetical protein